MIMYFTIKSYKKEANWFLLVRVHLLNKEFSSEGPEERGV